MLSGNRLRILSVIDDLYFGGDEYRLLAFGQTLDRNRFDLTLATILRPDAEAHKQHGSLREEFVASGIDVIHLDEVHTFDDSGSRSVVGLLRSGGAFWRRLRKLSRLIRERNIDLLDIHLAPANPLGVMAGLMNSRPSIVTLYQTMGMQSWPLWLSGQFNLCMADRLITDSEVQRDSIQRWTLRRRQLFVIPNGTSLRKSAVTSAQMRTMLGLSTDSRVRVVGQIGGLIPYKGQMVLLDAARLVLQEEPNVEFLLVGYVRGDPGYRDQLHQKAASLGIAGQVKIVSYAGNIADIWKVIDLHVHASLLDSLPNAILEGMSEGKPAVVTRVGGIPDVVEDGKTGLIVPPGDSRSLANALIRVLREPDLSARLGDAARERYLERFRPETMTARLEKCFLALANS
jgi:glycosyltransferase involved in cell wall biosynthesis